uniref:Putative ovule protein n=1 Tax=Solanum chacoense TaxID=4108 RepID=A0A0V0HJ51_SOLCH
MIGQLLFWNIRSVNSQHSFERVIDMNIRYNFAFIALLEPFQDPGEIEQYKRRLGFDRVAVNSSAKIWVFGKIIGKGR